MLANLTLTRKGKVIPYLAAVLLGWCTLVPAQQPPVVTFPAGPVTVTVPAAFTLEQGPGYITIRWGVGPTPTPQPIPPPGPVPVPVPTTANPLWAIAVLDTSKPLLPGHDAMRQSKTLPTSLKALGAEWRAYDATDPKLASWAKDLPAPPGLLLIEIKDGQAVKFAGMTLPADESGVVAAVKTARGQ